MRTIKSDLIFACSSAPIRLERIAASYLLELR
jgi:hypothetical protein